jgi:hypothetical protein
MFAEPHESAPLRPTIALVPQNLETRYLDLRLLIPIGHSSPTSTWTCEALRDEVRMTAWCIVVYFGGASQGVLACTGGPISVVVERGL